MGDLINLLAGEVFFPDQGAGIKFIGKFVYILIGAMYNHGAIGYGVAIIFFTLVLKLMLLPMDFANKYFTKRNAAKMAKFKPEEDILKEQYASDPMQLNRARQELYRKHGYKMGGFCGFMAINLVVTLCVFMSVFLSLRAVADYNVQLTAQKLQGVYLQYEEEFQDPDFDDTEFVADINKAYEQHNIGFLWIKNVWHSDVPWSPSGLTFGEYSMYTEVKTDYTRDLDTIMGFYGVSDEPELVAYFNETYPRKDKKGKLRDPSTNEIVAQYVYDVKLTQFNTIEPAIDSSYKRKWNGLLILIALAGATTYLSLYLNAKFLGVKKTKGEVKAQEKKAQYSMRNVKNQADQPKAPTVDPAMMGKVMKIALPIVMVIFTFMNTAALAIYIIANSVFSTVIMLGLNYPADKLVKWQEKRAEKRGTGGPATDTSVINPHAKYFKSKRSK